MLVCFKKMVLAVLETKKMRFPLELIAVCIRCYAAYPYSYHHLETRMQERGIVVDHLLINRWASGFFAVAQKNIWKIQTFSRWEGVDG